MYIKMLIWHVGILKMYTAGYSGVASQSIGDNQSPGGEMEASRVLRIEAFVGQSPRIRMLTADFSLSTHWQLIVKI